MKEKENLKKDEIEDYLIEKQNAPLEQAYWDGYEDAFNKFNNA